MSSKRLNLILAALIGLLFVGVVGGAYGANKIMTGKSNDLAKLKAKDEALSRQQTGLVKAKADLVKYAELEQIAHSVVPEDKNQAETVRQITNIAAEYKINIASITFPASTLGNSGAAAAGASSTGTTPAPTPATAGNSAAAKTSQLQPVKTIPGVYQLPITVSSEPTQPVLYSQFINFLSALEKNRRTAQVSNISIQPDTQNHQLVSFILVVNEYIKP